METVNDPLEKNIDSEPRKKSTSSVCSNESAASTSSCGSFYANDFPGFKSNESIDRKQQQAKQLQQLQQQIGLPIQPPEHNQPAMMLTIRKISNTLGSMMNNGRDGVNEVYSFVRNQMALNGNIESSGEFNGSVSRKISSSVDRTLSPGTFSI